MTRFARILDIAVRSFFMFVVCWLVFSYVFRGFFAVLAMSVAVTAGINAAFELTVGRKYWRAAAKSGPRRKFSAAARQAFARAFSRDKTKGFVWAGAVILMMSFFVRLNIYYITFACAVFGFAALTRFAPVPKCATINGGEQNNGEQAGGQGGAEQGDRAVDDRDAGVGGTVGGAIDEIAGCGGAV